MACGVSPKCIEVISMHMASRLAMMTTRAARNMVSLESLSTSSRAGAYLPDQDDDKAAQPPKLVSNSPRADRNHSRSSTVTSPTITPTAATLPQSLSTDYCPQSFSMKISILASLIAICLAFRCLANVIPPSGAPGERLSFRLSLPKY
jgi:hypothetical protein